MEHPFLDFVPWNLRDDIASKEKSDFALDAMSSRRLHTNSTI